MMQPPRKPKKPTMISIRPTTLIGMLWPTMALALPSALKRPIRAPRLITTARVKKPAIMCTQPAAPTSWKPHLTVSQPSGCQPQDAATSQRKPPRKMVMMMKALIRVRSISAPERIEPVVAANMAKAAQKMPVALSLMFGPMDWLQGMPAMMASMRGTMPSGKPL